MLNICEQVLLNVSLGSLVEFVLQTLGSFGQPFGACWTLILAKCLAAAGELVFAFHAGSASPLQTRARVVVL